MMKRLLCACALLVLVSAQSASAAVDVVKHAKDIARVESFLSLLTTIKADFEQVAPSGETASGTFYLQRPGKMRWEYNPPSPILLVSNGKTITYYDAEMDQINYITLDETLAGFLASETLKLNTDATELVGFEVSPGAVRATIRQRENPENGTLTIEFTDKPLVMKQLIITDAGGNETRIALSGAEYGKKLDRSLFIFKDPRGVIRRKR